MRILTTTLTLLISLQSIACPMHKSISAGEPAPCDGHFLNNQANEYVKRDLRDNELRKKQIELKDLQINELSKDRDNWKVEAEKQARLKHSGDNDLRNGVIAGVVMTLAVMFAVQKVGK